MNKIAIIADDQTGAGDSGIHFARAGKAMALMLDYECAEGQLKNFNRVAISTDTRFFDNNIAAQKVAQVIVHCQKAGFTDFFKKIDSTMRGNTGSEVAAAIMASKSRAALICPAIPRLGRTCVDGMILVDGQPLADSNMGQDPFHPLTTSNMAELLSSQTDFKSVHLSLAEIRGPQAALAARVTQLMKAGYQLLIADAEEQDDLTRLAALLADTPKLLPVGAAGLAEAIATRLMTQNDVVPNDNLTGRMLAVVGSLTEISRIQVDFARQQGALQVLELDVTAAKTDLDAEMARLLGEVKRSGGRHLLLRTKLPERLSGPPMDDGELVADFLGQTAKAICKAIFCPVVFATGGSTSVGVARALGIKVVTLRQELLPGVVLGECQVPGLGVHWFITKAGGFGNEQTLKKLTDLFPLHVEDDQSS